MNRKLPEHIHNNLNVNSYREYKQLKRQQLKQVIQAAEKYLQGAAWTPNNAIDLMNMLSEFKKAQSVKEWGN